MFGRALVVEEGMQKSLPSKWTDRKILTKQHTLRTLGHVTIVEYRIAETELAAAALELSECLKSRRYYAHIILDNFMAVSFPSICVYLHEAGSTEIFENCRQIGKLFSIPCEEMNFEEMFQVDHPDQV